MKRIRNFPGAGTVTIWAIATFVAGAASHAIAQNQPANQNSSNPPAATEPRAGEADQAARPDATAQRAALGIHFETQATPGQGLEIARVDPNGIAAQAGLQAHDRIISIDGRPFKHHRHAKAYLAAQAGRPVPLVIERNGRQLMVQIIPGRPEGESGWVGILLFGENELPPNGQNVPGAQPNAPGGQPNAAGGQPNIPGGQPNTAENNQNPAGSSPAPAANGQNATGQRGARVAQIYPGSPAARAGLQPGDLVTQINGQKIDDPAEVVALVSEMKPQTKAEFEVMRDNQLQKIPVTVGNRNTEFVESQNGSGQGQAGPDPNTLQRIEEEVRQLHEEVRQLREQLQKK